MQSKVTIQIMHCSVGPHSLVLLYAYNEICFDLVLLQCVLVAPKQQSLSSEESSGYTTAGRSCITFQTHFELRHLGTNRTMNCGPYSASGQLGCTFRSIPHLWFRTKMVTGWMRSVVLQGLLTTHTHTHTHTHTQTHTDTNTYAQPHKYTP